jgi:hypothetical protein
MTFSINSCKNSINSEKIVHDTAFVSFVVEGGYYTMTFGDAQRGMQKFSPSEKASLVFSHVVVSRCLTKEEYPSKTHYTNHVQLQAKGTVTAEQFAEILKYKKGISDVAWTNHVLRISGVPQDSKSKSP